MTENSEVDRFYRETRLDLGQTWRANMNLCSSVGRRSGFFKRGNYIQIYNPLIHRVIPPTVHTDERKVAKGQRMITKASSQIKNAHRE